MQVTLNAYSNSRLTLFYGPKSYLVELKNSPYIDAPTRQYFINSGEISGAYGSNEFYTTLTKAAIRADYAYLSKDASFTDKINAAILPGIYTDPRNRVDRTVAFLQELEKQTVPYFIDFAYCTRYKKDFPDHPSIYLNTITCEELKLSLEELGFADEDSKIATESSPQRK